MSLLDGSLAVALAVVLGYATPWAMIAMIAPVLKEAERARAVNYRGRSVFLGLGIVWLVWAGSAIIAGVAYASVFPQVATAPLLTLAGPLALVAFSLGVVDDALGSAGARGFKGHLRALASGRLTTGGLKLLGIGVASVFAALVLSGIAPWGASVSPGSVAGIASMLLAGAGIALTANLVNLTDLRPGRALKTYSVLALAGVCSAVYGLGPTTLEGLDVRSPGVELIVLAVMTLGPVLAVWKYDLGEQGMLGDAGANAMGSVAGVLIVSGLGTAGLVCYVAVMLGLNLLSERVSFSALIERNALLRRLDTLGRLREAGSTPDSPAQVPTDVASARYHSQEDHEHREA